MKLSVKQFKKLRQPNYIKELLSRVKFEFIRAYHEKLVFRVATKKSIFTSIWRHNYWGDKESLSGIGATLLHTENLRQNMPILFRELKIKTVFDAPCGDMNWMQYVLRNAEFTYLGGDIVNELIKKNRITFKGENIRFIKFDITSDTFPEADIWICRAVLYHFSNRDILFTLEKFSESNIKYILTTNCVTDGTHLNKDINTGDWRSLDLTLPPFNFPKEPLWEIDDCVEPHPPMKMSLWTREQIKNLLPDIRKSLER